jgi:hypothetical protein
VEAQQFDRWTRRTFGLAVGGVVASLFGMIAGDDAAAKKKKKHKKKKRRKPEQTNTPFCPAERVCAGGCCPSGQACQGGLCFPQGTCPAGAQACVPETGTKCGDDCFCVQSADGKTLCIESGGLCINFEATCQTAIQCSTCQSLADCPLGQACIDVSGCCDEVLGRTEPLPAGTKTCAAPCNDLTP